MNKFNLLLLFSLAAGCFSRVQAQLLTITNGTTINASPGVLFALDGLSLTPSAPCTFTNCSLNKNTTVTHPLNTNYIQRVYSFTGTAPVFTGTVVVNYNEGTELNSIPETDLRQYVYDNGSWHAMSGSNNVVANTVSSAVYNNSTITELTLGSAAGALPVQLLKFVAQKQNKAAQLQWYTAQEQNSKDFLVQHCTDGLQWQVIGTVSAAGNSSTLTQYDFIHANPVTGNNYYRLLQRDLDGKATYSNVQRVYFTADASEMRVLNNPVKNGLLQLQTSKPGLVNLFNQQGQLIYAQKIAAGLQEINVSTYASGIYYLSWGTETIKVLIE